MWMRMIVHVHLMIWCEKRCIQQERLNFEISPPIGNCLCLSNFSRLSNNNRNQVLKGFSIKLRFVFVSYLYYLFSMENVTTQCDILTDNLNAKSHDCFGSFVLPGLALYSITWIEIQSNIGCGMVLMRILPVFVWTHSFFIVFQCKSIRSGAEVATQIHRLCAHLLMISPTSKCQLINRRKKYTK